MVQPLREIRVALVLYGGVSLAIYENGVARTFHDLVRERGPFHLLLELLESRAVVDVIAGTSAGGINGIMLAAALESGSEFTSTSKLWRELGDIEKLLRPINVNQAESLLNGEGYYQDQLFCAFKELVRPPHDSQVYQSELDLFVTGTDLDGHIKTYWDELGTKIQDKSHRTVFQLKYRPGRTHLGVTQYKPKRLFDKSDLEDQAALLASIARITSSFPGAFPPFRVSQLRPEYRASVLVGLKANISNEDSDSTQDFNVREYVDGGVLNNKPFAPALRAIFRRMPRSLVDRRLFYVEPDPEQITQLSPEDKASESRHNPVGVCIAALTSIPSYQSIAENLEELRRHNETIKWFTERQTAFLNRIKDTKASPSDPQIEEYYDIRKENLAKTLLLHDEVVCAPDVVPKDLEKIFDELKRQLSSYQRQTIDLYDIDFHLRRAFFILYRLHSWLDAATFPEVAKKEVLDEMELRDTQKLLIGILAIGRIIKVLLFIRISLVNLRDILIPQKMQSIGPDDSISAALDAALLQSVFIDFLDTSAFHWKLLHQSIPLELEILKGENGPFGSLEVKDLAAQVNIFLEGLRKRTFPPVSSVQSRPTILDEIANQIVAVLQKIVGNNDLYTYFSALDQFLFPLRYACCIYELDEINFVRVSPKDASFGLSEGLTAKEKVTGDDLAHFAAFLRQDWRSNDILWGRLDAACQIIRSLLSDDERKRMSGRRKNYDALFTLLGLKKYFQNCPDQYLSQLIDCWNMWNSNTQDDKSWDDFKTAFVLCAQVEACYSDVDEVIEDRFYQDLTYGQVNEDQEFIQKPPPSRVTTNCGSGDTAISMAAKSNAGDYMRQATAKLNKAQIFLNAKLGSQTVLGPNGNVPLNIVGEYVSHAYLVLWAMINYSLGSLRIMDKTRARLFFRTPILTAHLLVRNLRKEPRAAFLAVMVLFGGLLTLGILGVMSKDHKWWLVSSLLSLIALSTILNWLTPEEFHRRSVRVALVILCVVILLASFAVYTFWRPQATLVWSYISVFPMIFRPQGVPLEKPYATTLLQLTAMFLSFIFVLMVIVGRLTQKLMSYPPLSEWKQPLLRLELPPDAKTVVTLLGFSEEPRGEVVRERFARSIELDWIFIGLYTSAFMTIAFWLNLRKPILPFGLIATVGAVIGAVLDVFENLILRRMLKLKIDHAIPTANLEKLAKTTYWISFSKWAVIFITVGVLSLTFTQFQTWSVSIIFVSLLLSSIIGLIGLHYPWKLIPAAMNLLVLSLLLIIGLFWFRSRDFLQGFAQ